MPRATFLLPHLRPSGGVRHILELAGGLSALGWDVTARVVGSPSPWMKEADLLPSRLEGWWPGYPGSVRCVNFSAGPLRALRPAAGEVVVTYGDAENELFSGRYLRDSPSVLLVLDWMAFDPRRQMAYLRHGTWDAVLCSTPFLRGRIAEAAGIDAWEIGAGVDRRQFRPAPAPGRGCPVLGSQHGAPANKGWPDVLSVAEAASRLSGDRVEVCSYGPSPGPDLSLVPNGVFVRHSLDPDGLDLRAVYSACDAWLCTSASEGYGFPSLEAMACGVPVVTYANGGHSAFMEDGVNGYVVPVGDVRAAAERCAAIAADPALAARLREGALRTAEALSWPAAAARTDAALRAVLDARGIR